LTNTKVVFNGHKAGRKELSLSNIDSTLLCKEFPNYQAEGPSSTCWLSLLRQNRKKAVNRERQMVFLLLLATPVFSPLHLLFFPTALFPQLCVPLHSWRERERAREQERKREEQVNDKCEARKEPLFAVLLFPHHIHWSGTRCSNWSGAFH